MAFHRPNFGIATPVNAMKVRPLSSFWPPDWETQIEARVQSLGHRRVREFVDAHLGEGFVDLAKRLGRPIVPLAMITTLYYRDAHVDGDIRSAACQGLLRGLWDRTPDGWKNYDERLTPGVREIGVFVSWDEELCAVDESVHSLAEAVTDGLWHSSPPKGWSPAGPDDPILRAAFDAGWPADTGPTGGDPPAIPQPPKKR